MPSSGERTLNVPVGVQWTFFWMNVRKTDWRPCWLSSRPKPFLTWSIAFQWYVRMPRDVLYKHMWIYQKYPIISVFAAFEVEAQWGVQLWADWKYHRWSFILKISIVLPAIIEPHFGIICCQSESSTVETSWKLVWGMPITSCSQTFCRYFFSFKKQSIVKIPWVRMDCWKILKL